MKKLFTLHRLGRHVLLLIGALIMSSVSVRAQDREISGRVTDDNGDPIIGATVAVTGTTTGTSTGADGMFRLRVPSSAKYLTVKFLGSADLEVPVEGNRTSYSIIMADRSTDIEDVVVIGYGTVAKRDLTGAVSSVSGKALASVPMANTASAMTGRMAGVQITTTDGSPDADVKIRVRGGGSITQDNSPLYIVDGFPVERISDISVNDIASIDVLKDAASSAIYGARGANGVVIITTKTAQAGKPVISYNGYMQFKYIPSKIDVMNPYEFVLLQYELSNILGGEERINGFANRFGTPDDFDIYKGMAGKDSQEEMYGRTVGSKSHNLSISAGSDKTRFTISGTHVNEEGVLITSGFERTNLNFKFNHQLYRAVKIDLSAYYTRSIIEGAGTTANTSTEIKNAVSYRPVIGKGSWSDAGLIEDAEAYEDIESTSTLYDPVELVKQDYKRQKRSDLNLNGAVSWNILKQLTLRSDYGVMTRDSETRRYWGPLTYTARQAGSRPIAQIALKENPRWRTSHTLTYNVENYKGRHNITVMGGFEAQKDTSYEILFTPREFQEGIPVDDIFANLSSGSREKMVSTDGTPVALASFFGRANYSYKGKILASATIRADGSSKFAPGRQWGYFPSAAVAWRISDEPFLKQTPWISDIKLRASFGQAGNNRIADDLWRRTFKLSFDSEGMYAGFGNVPQLYYVNNSTILINENLKWETTTTRNIGLDFSFFKSRLSGTLEVYSNSTRDLLLQSPIPLHTGYANQQVNMGRTTNRGFEATVNGVIVDTKDFTLTANFNIGFNRNRVDQLDHGLTRKFYQSGWMSSELRETHDYLLEVGRPVGQIYGYVTDGFYTVDDYVDGSWTLKPGVANSQPVTGSNGAYSGNPRVGSLKLKKMTPVDPNDPESYKITPEDRVVIGNADPKHSGGLNLSAVCKGFDLSVFFTWVYGNDIYNAQKILNTTTWKYQWYNLRSEMGSQNRFRIFDDAGNDLRSNRDALRELNANASIWSPVMQYPVLHSWAIEDGSFLRLSNLTLGYTLPQKVTQKWHMSQLRLYATGNNLFCLTNYSGFDPEVDTRRSTPLTPGVDYSAYPKTRSFTFGVNLTF